MLTPEQTEKAQKVEQRILEFIMFCWFNFPLYQQDHGGNPIEVILRKSNEVRGLIQFIPASFELGEPPQGLARANTLISILRQMRQFFEEYTYSSTTLSAGDGGQFIQRIDAILEATQELSGVLPRS